MTTSVTSNTIQTTLTDTLKLGGTTAILLTPYTDETGTALGTTTYSLDNIVGDSTEIAQEDAETNEIECETRDEPIFENVTLGNYTFTAESGDIQAELLTNCFGFTQSGKFFYAPTSYKEIWALIEVQFGTDGARGSLICPKVKIRLSVSASSLKTDMVRGVIEGTCYSTYVKISEGTLTLSTSDDSDASATPFIIYDPNLSSEGE